MPAATIEQSSKETTPVFVDTTPVFVAGGRHRNHAARLAAATLGLLLAGWLAALAAGLIGFSPLPELTLPATGSAQSAPPDQGPQPATERDASAHASPIASRPAGGDDNVSAAGSSARDASGSGIGGAGGQAGSGGSGTGSTSSGGGAPQSQTTPPAGGTATPTSSGDPPSFTPPASGETSASPPRGSSANAQGKTISPDPPGRATRADSG